MADDDLRGDLMAAFQNPSATPAASVDAPLPGSDTPPAPAQSELAAPATPAAEVKPPVTDDRPRNADGTFRAKDGTETPAPAADAPVAPNGAAPPQPATPAERIAPPDNWKGAAKVAWDRLPKAVQQEIVADYARIGQSDSQYGALRQVVEPVRLQYAAEYGSVEKAVEQLIALEQYARNKPEDFIRQFAQSRGINLGAPAAQPQQPGIDPALAPVVQPILEKLTAVEQKLSAFEGSTQQQHYNANLSTVQAFCADPAHPYVNDVWEDMQALIESGRVAKGPNVLQDAYDRAIWASPTVRAQLQEQLRDKEKAEQQARVDAAKKASASLTGSPLPGATPEAGPERDLRSEIVANFQRAGGRI